MTVGELIEKLRQFPSNLPIYFEDNEFCSSREFPSDVARVEFVEMCNHPYRLDVDCVRFKG